MKHLKVLCEIVCRGLKCMGHTHHLAKVIVIQVAKYSLHEIKWKFHALFLTLLLALFFKLTLCQAYKSIGRALINDPSHVTWSY